MKKLVFISCVQSTIVMAGTVHFNPPSATITPGTQSVSIDVSVSWETMQTIDSVNVVIRGDLNANLSFSFFQSFVDSTSITPAPPAEESWYCGIAGCTYEEIGFGGNNFNPGWASPLLIGTLTVDTSALQAGEVDRIRVDPNEESELFGDPAIYLSLISHAGGQEPIAGATTITVVPEPATLGILALGVLAISRRRTSRAEYLKLPLLH